jgi:hypothetical protein
MFFRSPFANLTYFRFTVIDEADELLSAGWEEAMEKIFQGGGMCSFLHYLLTTFSNIISQMSTETPITPI